MKPGVADRPIVGKAHEQLRRALVMRRILQPYFTASLKGILDIELRDKTITLVPGDMYVVPKGVEHRPVARDEVHLLLIEPTGTPNTGDARTASPRRLA